MKRAESQQRVDVWQEVHGLTSDLGASEEPLLVISELEPRLTPDGWGSSGNGHNSNPPGGQVGWGC
jgi:hypothetical protein